MGSAISTAGSAVVDVLGAPFKGIFGGSCNEFCSETWDVVCFVEHLCVSNLLRLLMIFGLGYIGIVMVYLILRIGMFQCMAKGFCKMWWRGCMGYIHIIEFSIFSLFLKLKHVKRVDRRHRLPHDIENGFSSSEHHDWKSKSRRPRRRRRRSFRLGRQVSVVNYGSRSGRRYHGFPRARVISRRVREWHSGKRSRFS